VNEPQAALTARDPESPAYPVVPIALRDWLMQREPPIPEALLLHLDGAAAAVGSEGLLETLLAEAGAALQDARAGEGERRGAFRLLAADAYLTYACEVALALEDPSTGLREVTQRVTREVEGG
jgi:hypothetical protein